MQKLYYRDFNNLIYNLIAYSYHLNSVTIFVQFISLSFNFLSPSYAWLLDTKSLFGHRARSEEYWDILIDKIIMKFC